MNNRPRHTFCPIGLLPGTEKKARGARSFLGVAAGRLALARLPWSLLVSFGGVGAGRRPFLVRPDSPAHLGARAESAPPPPMGIARPGRLLSPAPRARRPRRTRSAASRRSTTGRGRIRRQRVREPRHRRPAGGARRPEAPPPAGAARATTRPSSPPTGPRRRGPSIGGRPPASAGSAASPTHASGGAAGRGRIRRWAAWTPRGSGTRDCPRGKRLAGRRGSAAGSDAPSSPAISATPSPSARRRLIYKMVGMPTISLPASLGRLPKQRPKWANRGEWPAPLPMRRKKRRERRNSYLANP